MKEKRSSDSKLYSLLMIWTKMVQSELIQIELNLRKVIWSKLKQNKPRLSF